MELLVSTPTNILAHAITSNPYQARNFLLPHLSDTFTYHDPHTIDTHFGLRIKCTAELPSLLQPTPTIKNETPFETRIEKEIPKMATKVSGLISLRSICDELCLQPVVARRILRKHYGANNVRYEWSAEEIHHIKTILKR